MTPTALRTVELGATGLQITRVGFGAWAIGGGGYEGGWGPQDDEDSIAAIHRAEGDGATSRAAMSACSAPTVAPTCATRCAA